MIRILLYWLALSLAIVLFRLLIENRVHVIMYSDFWSAFGAAAGITLVYYGIISAALIALIYLLYHIKNRFL